MTRALALVAAAPFLLTACKKENTAAAAAAAGPIAVAVGAENVGVVTVSEIRTGPTLSGALAADQEATVRAEVPGAVLQVFVEPGQRVAKGQPIARLDEAALRDAFLGARSGMTTAQSNYENARRELERTESLEKAGAVAPRMVEQVRTGALAAQSQLADARARLTQVQQQLGKATIRAPFSGIVSARPVNAGDVVAPGAPIVTVVNPSSMRFEASVPANEVSQIRVGLPVEFSVKGYEGRRFTGRIARVNPVADPMTRQVQVWVTVPNAQAGLVGGLYAEGRVAAETRTVTVVPLSALEERGLKPAVLRVRGGKTERVDVTPGIRDLAAEVVEIRTGLAVGDTVLLGAARAITAGTPVTMSRLIDAQRPQGAATPPTTTTTAAPGGPTPDAR